MSGILGGIGGIFSRVPDEGASSQEPASRSGSESGSDSEDGGASIEDEQALKLLQLETKLSAIERENAVLQQDKDGLNAQLQTVQERAKTTEAALAEANRAKDAAAAESSDATAQLAEATQQIAALNARVLLAEETSGELTGLNQALKDQKEQAVAEIASLSRRVEEAAKENASVAAERDAFRTQLDAEDAGDDAGSPQAGSQNEAEEANARQRLEAEVEMGREEEQRRAKALKLTPGDAATGPRADAFEDPLVVEAIPVQRLPSVGVTLVPEDTSKVPGSLVGSGGSKSPGGDADVVAGDDTDSYVDDDKYNAIAAEAIGYAHRGQWYPEASKVSEMATLEGAARNGSEYAFFGALESSVDTLVIPFSKFVQDIRPFPAVRDDTHVVRLFMRDDDRQPLYIRLQNWRGDDPRLSEVRTYREHASGKIFKVTGFSLLSESFLRTKAEAMRLVRDVAKKAVGLDNARREFVMRRANEIVSDTTWTVSDVNPGAVGAAASLFEAARNMLDVRSDLGRSWRSGTTVAMVNRAASTSALDFINAEFIPGAPNPGRR